MLDTVVLSGEGSYEGWTAYLLVGRDPDSDDPTLKGVLFADPMPVAP